MKVTEATEKGDGPALTDLLAAGTDPNECDEEGTPALYLAVEEEQEEAVQVLLEHGPNVNCITTSGTTPLSHAAFLCNNAAGEGDLFVALFPGIVGKLILPGKFFDIDLWMGF